jgi:esterase/lipase superfamily enzyme
MSMSDTEIVAEWVITSIELDQVPGSTSMWSFNGLKQGTASADHTATILHNVTKSRHSFCCCTPVYMGTKVTVDYFVNHFNNVKNNKIPLLCVHGFGTQPPFWLETCAKYPRGKKYRFTAIPVIWPCGDLGLVSYFGDRHVALGTAASFLSLLMKSSLQPLRQVSLMCHSMGNYILWLVSQSLTNSFDHIFMVAADVDDDIFKDGRKHNVPQMVRCGGKIHVLFCNRDKALRVRRLVHCGRTALGRNGPVDVGQAVQPKIQPVNARAFISAGWLAHSYYFSAGAIAYYEQVVTADDGEVTA